MAHAPAANASWAWWRSWLLRCWRLGALALICWFIREQHLRARVQGDLPITLVEVAEFFPDAARLRVDHSEREGMFVLGVNGEELGYVVRTSPYSDHIKGYAGPTDVLIAFDPEFKVTGITVHYSNDTRSHVRDVLNDRHFRKSWKGRTWEETADLNLKAAGVEGVSGATMTSMAMAEGIVHRLKDADARLSQKPEWNFQFRDAGLAFVIVGACWLAFSRQQGRSRWRRAFQVVVVIYVGLIQGDLIAQSLLAGWAKSGVALHAAPGLVLLVAAALLVPWMKGKPLYCQQICPHGIAQEWLGKLLPARFRWRLHPDVAKGLRWLPGMLLGLVLIVVMLRVPLDLADVEPFDAWLITSAGWATIAIAVTGLTASLFVPQAYCKYGCPTGALLEYGRSHGDADRLGRRDVVALILLALALVLNRYNDLIHTWLMAQF